MRRAARERTVEIVLEEIEHHLRSAGTVSIMGVWNSLTGWRRGITVPFVNWRLAEWPSPSLINTIRNVFKSLDRHGMIVCARYDRAGRRCMTWKDSASRS